MALQIKITGKTGDGKSTLAQLVRNLLVTHGLNVKLTDSDDLSDIPIDLLATKIAGIASKNGVISITTEQAPRTNYKEN